LKVGLTGGIACGKSTVAEMLAAAGAHVLKADEVGHRLMQPGQPVYEEIVRRFGREILDPDGTINRPRLAGIAFAPGKERIQELNEIIHPLVVAEQDRWMQKIGNCNPSAIAVIEAALMLEAGARGHFDCIVVVVCRPEQKIERLARRLHMNWEAARQEVERRSAAQWPDERKAREADFVIDNSGSLEQTAQQVQGLMTQLKQLAVRA
jgi:dephospho-CoA kinase